MLLVLWSLNTFSFINISIYIQFSCIFPGIDICTWKVPYENESISYSVWDFAGQTVYYNTHQVSPEIKIPVKTLSVIIETKKCWGCICMNTLEHKKKKTLISSPFKFNGIFCKKKSLIIQCFFRNFLQYPVL